MPYDYRLWGAIVGSLVVDGIRRDGAARREGDCERIGENARPPPYETVHDHTAFPELMGTAAR
jgi:hypothetical protein